ncbi:hypothetical protein COCSUDRAFT_34638 [Coccomyxa subellipsoidea C-169]|uniref:Uncharacterized protein n=1 Tax=Coccomyxa subellipsoidea (strain C-169) TaxID=574566 RepID=I0YI80_COCSC|nr:hypothetical protein COCSUDRAFT_34638 [Coccomyxa subellipsoidea C-169]EIE18099.1 hypothetical protein COCSUDRAFT_34638 [Coccomyxa subellipsoidea C-169]|eukprot:XP_005642643.1 hypothetical protein COCSUDRAFT_34638 [Coccomyxa subellipsoidea C-169]
MTLFHMIFDNCYILTLSVARCLLTRQNPYDDFAYDGLMINPLEVLFVKIKSYQLESNWITSKMAITYERWHRDQVLFLASYL